MVSNSEVMKQGEAQRSTAGFWPPLTRRKLLLAVELIAVLGILAAAFQLWQVRQSLAEDLATARQVQSLLTEGQPAAQPAPADAQELRHEDPPITQPAPAASAPELSLEPDATARSDASRALRGAVRGR